jgi:hypothetical protein
MSEVQQIKRLRHEAGFSEKHVRNYIINELTETSIKEDNKTCK